MRVPLLRRNLRSDLLEGRIALRPWLGERAWIFHSEATLTGLIRDHVCGSPGGNEIFQRSSDRAIGSMKESALGGRNLAKQGMILAKQDMIPAKQDMRGCQGRGIARRVSSAIYFGTLKQLECSYLDTS